MSKLQTYFDNLVTHLATAGDGLLTEITAKHVLFVTGDDPDLPKSVDEHVKRMVMQTKGLGLVIYADDGSNNNADAPDSDLDANITFEVRLFIHPRSGGANTTRQNARPSPSWRISSSGSTGPRSSQGRWAASTIPWSTPGARSPIPNTGSGGSNATAPCRSSNNFQPVRRRAKHQKP